MVARVMLGHGYEPGMGLSQNGNGVASLVEFAENCGRFGLGYEPTRANMRRSAREGRERSMGQLQGLQVKGVPLCHIDENFVSAGWMYEGRVAVIHEETLQEQPNWVRPCPPKFELGNCKSSNVGFPWQTQCNSLVLTLLLGLGLRVCSLFGHVFCSHENINTQSLFI